MQRVAPLAVVHVSGPLSCVTPSAEFVRRSLWHMLDLKLTALLVLLCVAPAGLCCAVVFNAVLDDYVASYRGIWPVQDAVLPADLLQSLKGGADSYPALMGLLVGISFWTTWASLAWMRTTPMAFAGDAYWHAGTIVFSASTLVLAALVPGNYTLLTTLGFVGSLGLLIAAARRLGRALGLPAVGTCATLQLLASASMLFLYSRAIPLLVLDADSDDTTRLLMRLVLHPLLVELAVIPVRSFGRAMGPEGSRATCAYSVVVYSSGNVFGRYLVSTLQSWGAITLAVAVISVQEVVLRSTVKRREAFYLRAFRGRTREQAKQEVETPTGACVLATLLVTDQVMEDAAIGITSLWALLLRVSYEGPEVAPSTVLGAMLLQLAAETATDCAPVALAVALSHGSATTTAVGPAAGPDVHGARSGREALGLRWKQTAANAHNAWRAIASARQRLLIALVAGAWTTYIVRFTFFPMAAWCPVSAVRVLGLNWWRIVPCSVLSA